MIIGSLLGRTASASCLLVLAIATAAAAGAWITGSARAGPRSPLAGRVLDPSGKPAPGARVRIQAADLVVISDAEGAFVLEGLIEPAKITAALPGYRIGYSVAAPQDSTVEVRLKPLPAADNPGYVWEPPTTCSQCHALIHQEWSGSAHARAAVDPVVLAMYRGTRHDGSPSPGFGFRKAHPESYGDCAFCHAPAFAARSADPQDPLEPHHDLDRAVAGSEAERSGVTCDFCHKVRAVEVNDQPPRVGRKLTLLRPPQFEPLMFGPFDDVTFVGMGAAHSPLHQSSDLCSLCHWDSNSHGAPVGSTYKEWLDSPYSAEGKRCQDCHMPSSGETDVFCLWEPVTRNPRRLSTHGFRGTDAAQLSRAVTVELSAARRDGPSGPEVACEVEVTNTGAGHAVPTGVTMRQAILVVEARRASGFPLELLEGPRLPAWAGEGGPPEAGYLAGQPGRGYAKITSDGRDERVFDSEATSILADTRLAARSSDLSSYRFSLNGYQGPVAVRARVIHRRFWRDLRDERGFPDGDTLMAERAETVPGGPPEFIRGDADGSGRLDLTDALVTLGFYFRGDPGMLPCPDAADADDSGKLEITDGIRILGRLFLGDPPLPAPFPEAGPDPNQDALDC